MKCTRSFADGILTTKICGLDKPSAIAILMDRGLNSSTKLIGELHST